MALTLSDFPQITTALPGIFGFAVTFLIGLGVPHFHRCVSYSLPLELPNPLLADKWKRVTNGNEGGKVIGHLERVLFFAALWNDAVLIVGAWLALKVASKWEAWSNVVSVPKEIKYLGDLEYLTARRQWGSHLYATFLVGTLANILAGYFGVIAGRYMFPLRIIL